MKLYEHLFRNRDPHEIVLLDDLANISRDLALASCYRLLRDPPRADGELGHAEQEVRRDGHPNRVRDPAAAGADRQPLDGPARGRCRRWRPTAVGRVPSPPSGPCTSRHARFPDTLVVEQAVLRQWAMPSRTAGNYRINLRSYLNATAELRSRAQLASTSSRTSRDEYKSDEEALRAWFLKVGGRTTRSAICNGLRPYPGQTGPVTDLVRKMVARASYGDPAQAEVGAGAGVLQQTRRRRNPAQLQNLVVQGLASIWFRRRSFRSRQGPWPRPLFSLAECPGGLPGRRTSRWRGPFTSPAAAAALASQHPVYDDADEVVDGDVNLAPGGPAGTRPDFAHS